MITNSTPKFKKHFFLDLAKSGRSGQYLAGTGPEPDLKKLTGSTGTGFPVAHCAGVSLEFLVRILESWSDPRRLLWLRVFGSEVLLQNGIGSNSDDWWGVLCRDTGEEYSVYCLRSLQSTFSSAVQVQSREYQIAISHGMIRPWLARGFHLRVEVCWYH